MQLINLAAAALLATAPSVMAAKARIVNDCDFEVYVWSVDSSDAPQTPTKNLSQGDSYEEEYRTVATGGVSLKMGKTAELYDYDTNSNTKITQFEYTLGSTLWYDLSNVNCDNSECPFAAEGMYLEPGNSQCPTVSCPGGVETCHAAYNAPNDNWASMSCPDSIIADITIYVCGTGPGQDGNSTSSSAQSSSESANATATATATTISTAYGSTGTSPANMNVVTTAVSVVKSYGANKNLDQNNVFTTFVTQVVTVEARAAEPTAIVKRHQHHGHRHGHQENPQ